MKALFSIFAAAVMTLMTAGRSDAVVTIDINDGPSGGIVAEARGSLVLPVSNDYYNVMGRSFMYGNQPAFAIGGATDQPTTGRFDRGLNVDLTSAPLFATRGIGNATTASGALLGFSATSFFVDAFYVSGTPFAASAFWRGWTLATAELIEGTFTYSIGTDSIVLAIGNDAIAQMAAVPLPAGGVLLLAGLGGFMVLRRRA